MVVPFPKTCRPPLAPLAAPTAEQLALAVAFIERAVALASRTIA